MNGIEILAIEEVVTKEAFSWNAFLITVGVTFAVFIVCGIIMSIKYDDWMQLLIGAVIGLFMGGIFGGIMGAAFSTPSEYETQYKITISDEVQMNDFIDKYEIIEQSGKLYTVRERTGE